MLSRLVAWIQTHNIPVSSYYLDRAIKNLASNSDWGLLQDSICDLLRAIEVPTVMLLGE